jgi:protocatechuate 3,4-dioxygenase alpha subunit
VLGADPLLSTLDADERGRMVAVREADGSLRFDIHLQGTLETPFLTFPGQT